MTTKKLVCKTCKRPTWHRPNGAQKDEKGKATFYLYTCEECHTTRAVTKEMMRRWW